MISTALIRVLQSVNKSNFTLQACIVYQHSKKRSLSTIVPRWTAERVLEKHGLTTDWLKRQRLTIHDYKETLFSRRLGFERREVRLLYIMPSAHPSSTVEMIMAHCSLDEHPSYEALSYTGGNPYSNTSSKVQQKNLKDPWEEKFTVLVNDVEFEVKRNLMEALRQFRKTHAGKAIWIDSICINEADPVERTEQIRLMCEVYGEADDVPIWLGEQTFGVNTALSLITDIIGAFTNWYNKNHPPGFRDHWYRILREAEATPDALDQKQFWEWLQSEECKPFFDCIDLRALGIRTDRRAIDSLRSLLSRRWFDRVWTWQEKELATKATVYIGDRILPWAKLGFAMLLVMAHDLSETRVTPTVLMPGREYLHVLDSLGIARSPDLLDIVQNVRHRETQLRRDKIFGVLGAAARYEHPPNKDVEHFSRLVNYGYLTTQDLYKEFSRYWILEKRDLRVLQDCNPSKKKISELPSWVVDWSDTSPSHQLSSRLYNASRGTDVDVKYHYHQNPDELRLAGVAIDTVSFVFQDKNIDKSERHLGPRSADIEHWRDKLVEPLASLYVTGIGQRNRNLLPPTWQNALDDIDWHGSYQHTGQSMPEAFWRTLLADQTPYLTNATDRRIDRNMDIASIFHRWAHRKALHRSLLLESMRERKEDDVARRRWVEALEMSLLYKRLFITKQGCIGLAPHDIQAGDIICVFLGGKVPFSLRKKDESYTLVDETYLHGFMDGEAIDLLEQSALNRTIFCIR
jgi:hypothetical protein